MLVLGWGGGGASQDGHGAAARTEPPSGRVLSGGTRADGLWGPRRGGSLGTKASGDSCSCVANARGSLLDFTSGGGVSLHLSGKV